MKRKPNGTHKTMKIMVLLIVRLKIDLLSQANTFKTAKKPFLKKNISDDEKMYFTDIGKLNLTLVVRF
jgi:hypothetical protein